MVDPIHRASEIRSQANSGGGRCGVSPGGVRGPPKARWLRPVFWESSSCSAAVDGARRNARARPIPFPPLRASHFFVHFTGLQWRLARAFLSPAFHFWRLSVARWRPSSSIMHDLQWPDHTAAVVYHSTEAGNSTGRRPSAGPERRRDKDWVRLETPGWTNRSRCRSCIRRAPCDRNTWECSRRGNQN